MSGGLLTKARGEVDSLEAGTGRLERDALEPLASLWRAEAMGGRFSMKRLWVVRGDKGVSAGGGVRGGGPASLRGEGRGPD